ncbi:cell cycle transcriptional regulator TrcR [Yunchengibacter salinarum]|uniref:cell cycle transcriptional regulator TrcR n=1 Tax=Yunchengibacter salinarum TaxID=3133399 RepID=UPI0035B5EE58
MTQPLMPLATAVWLVDNTALTFKQIADFCELHELEVQGIADGTIATNMVGQDPTTTNQLTWDEINRCQADPDARLEMVKDDVAAIKRTKGPRYTPLSKRQDKPDAIAWLVRHHPELSDLQISRLVGTTKPTIQSIRDGSHWNKSNIRAQDPVQLGLCRQTELDEAVREAADKKARKEAKAEAEAAQDAPKSAPESEAATAGDAGESGETS